MEVEKIMENRIKNFLEEPTKIQKARKSEAVPMREILEELFVWCQGRFPELKISTVEMQGNS